MRVLIATDGSLHAEKAARFFSHLPHREPLELQIVAVRYFPIVPSTPEFPVVVDQYYETDKLRLRKACETIAAMFDGALVEIKCSVLDGHPGEILVDLTETKSIDLIVLGAVGHSTLDRLLLGSVSDYVATHAKCSVLVIRNTLLDDLYDHDLKICYAYDGSERCQAALVDIARFDWKPTMHIDMVHVVRLPQIFSDIPIPIDTSELKATASRELQQGKAAVNVLSSKVETHLRESDHVGDALVHFCAQHKNDLLLIGDTGRGLVSRMFLGSVSRHVLREGSCSVWIGRKQA